MTKRILALLLAVLFAVSCCMMTACGDDKKPTDDKTQQTDDKKPATDDKKPNEDKTSDKTPGGDKTSEDKTSEVPSEPLTDADPADEFKDKGTPIDIQFYSGAPFETWTGPDKQKVTWTWFQSVVTISPDEADLKDGVGTDDYAYKWTMHVRPAEAALNDDKADDKWTDVVCQLDTLSGVGDLDIYRPQPGTGLEKVLKVDNDYEFVFTIEGPDGQNFRSQYAIYKTWEQKDEDAYQNWKAGKDVNGAEANCFVPEGAPHDGLTPTSRTPVA